MASIVFQGKDNFGGPLYGHYNILAVILLHTQIIGGL